MSKSKFNIGDYIESNSGTQRYIIVDIDETNEVYICVDALCARGALGILYNRNYKDFIGWGQEEDFKLYTGEQLPVVADKYVDEYNLPNEWRWSNYKK